MSQNLQNFVKFQKFQLENLVDFEKCCQTHIYLQKSEPIQPKTSNILPKICRSAVVSPTGAPLLAHAAVEEHDTVFHRLVEVLMGPVLQLIHSSPWRSWLIRLRQTHFRAQTSNGSISAVSTPIFTIEYLLEIYSQRDLQDVHCSRNLHFQNFTTFVCLRENMISSGASCLFKSLNSVII